MSLAMLLSPTICHSISSSFLCRNNQHLCSHNFYFWMFLLWLVSSLENQCHLVSQKNLTDFSRPNCCSAQHQSSECFSPFLPCIFHVLLEHHTWPISFWVDCIYQSSPVHKGVILNENQVILFFDYNPVLSSMIDTSRHSSIHFVHELKPLGTIAPFHRLCLGIMLFCDTEFYQKV